MTDIKTRLKRQMRLLNTHHHHCQARMKRPTGKAYWLAKAHQAKAALGVTRQALNVIGHGTGMVAFMAMPLLVLALTGCWFNPEPTAILVSDDPAMLLEFSKDCRAQGNHVTLQLNWDESLTRMTCRKLPGGDK